MSTLLQKDVREEINARKRGEPLGDDYKGQANYGGAASGGRNSGSSGGGLRGAQCHTCGKVGHVRRDCPEFLATVQCNLCGQMGHIAATCKLRNNEGNGRKVGGGGGGAGRKMCTHCKMGGHTIEMCFILARDKEGAARLAANSSSDYDASHDSLLYSASSHVYSTSTNGRLPLILDSGATDHIFPSSACFSKYSTEGVPMQSSFIYTVDNKPHEVVGSGVVTLLLHNGMESTTVHLKALTVPSLGQTLLTLGFLNKRGGVAFNLSEAGVPTLIREGKPWAELKPTSNGLLILSGRIVMPG